ncbi:MAG TPA: hypothetical protein VJL58_01475, partial [Pyrinomonadaceae bacterium]|nr:hypothetical protein [Pyrinomonadaceae bacterium]
MLFRAIALSIALLIGIGTIIPLATDIAEAGPKRAKKYKKHKKYRKYSKRWWRQYRAAQRRKRALQARRRALRLRQLRLARARSNNKAVRPRVASVTKPKEETNSASSLLPSGEAAPTGWRRSGSTGSEVQFAVDGGSAAISVVGPAMGETVDTGRNRMVGGVSTSALRREVINRMIRENGWVVNDYQKEIGGRSVYVVVAQSQQNGGRTQSRMFYFTEADGRIYSVSTNSSTDSADRIAEESEKVIYSLRPRS